MTTPLTTEEVAKIRLPPGVVLFRSNRKSLWAWVGDTGETLNLSSTEHAMVYAAALWALIEGRPLVPTCETCRCYYHGICGKIVPNSTPRTPDDYCSRHEPVKP